jgi:hypothetical protein
MYGSAWIYGMHGKSNCEYNTISSILLIFSKPHPGDKNIFMLKNDKKKF